MGLNFYLVKSHKIVTNLATTEAEGEIKHRFGILGILEIKLVD